MKTKIIAALLGVSLFAYASAGQASAQFFGGYGNGRHDLSPHGHTVQTPFGGYSYYGNGLHDLRPHGHTISPYSGVTSYNNGIFRSTQSYNGFPGYGGFGGYRGSYGNGGGYGSHHHSSRFGGW